LDQARLVPVAFSCFIVILAQGSATSRAYSLRYEEPFDENVDLVGLSLANIAAGCSGTFVVNGSPTKTPLPSALISAVAVMAPVHCFAAKAKWVGERASD
jgi:MFS superfamily sulfate permease-like transporter